MLPPVPVPNPSGVLAELRFLLIEERAESMRVLSLAALPRAIAQRQQAQAADASPTAEGGVEREAPAGQGASGVRAAKAVGSEQRAAAGLEAKHHHAPPSRKVDGSFGLAAHVERQHLHQLQSGPAGGEREAAHVSVRHRHAHRAAAIAARGALEPK
jgi:hypothetical protein